jgi:hypothetical protein
MSIGWVELKRAKLVLLGGGAEKMEVKVGRRPMSIGWVELKRAKLVLLGGGAEKMEVKVGRRPVSTQPTQSKMMCAGCWSNYCLFTTINYVHGLGLAGCARPPLNSPLNSPSFY